MAIAYTLEGKLMERDGSSLHRAVRAVDGRQVILKIVDSRLCRPRELERLQNEYEIGRTLESACVARTLSLDAWDGLSVLVLDDFDGVPLSRLLVADGSMPIERFLRIAGRIARAVVELHRAGVVHKDLKPDNILVAPETDEVRIIGFGIASRLLREQTAPRSAYLIEGSSPYISPE
jgi:serine/threonine protein kinase